jgi:hypothetical protein
MFSSKFHIFFFTIDCLDQILQSFNVCVCVRLCVCVSVRVACLVIGVFTCLLGSDEVSVVHIVCLLRLVRFCACWRQQVGYSAVTWSNARPERLSARPTGGFPAQAVDVAFPVF